MSPPKKYSAGNTKPFSDGRKDRLQGNLFIISAPSGAGKTTLCNAVLEYFPDMRYSISYTTRIPRAGEQDHIDYHFISKAEFEKGIESDRWAEWAEVHGYFYGTSAEFIEREQSAGKDILLDIDIQGTMQILKKYPGSITIFIMPPSVDVLRERLEKRDTDSEAVIERRLINAKAEMAQKERYRHLIINDRLKVAKKELIDLIATYRL